MSEFEVRSVQSPRELSDILAGLKAASQTLFHRSIDDLLTVFSDWGAMWQPGGELFQEALRLLRGTFSDRSVSAALSSLAMALDADFVRNQLDRELGRYDLLDRWQADEFAVGHVRGYPLGVVAQVLAGNVFLGGAVGLAQCLLTKNGALLKLSRKDSGFTALFAKSLHEADATGLLRDCIAVCEWDSEQNELNQVLRDEADAVVVWGGAGAIAAYPPDRCRGRVIHYGPRLGIGFVLDGVNAETTLSSLAWDIALWEQQACSSPRVLFVEDADRTGSFPRAVARELSTALHRVGAELPARSLTLDEKTEVYSLRESAYWIEESELIPTESMDHTVCVLKQCPREIPIGYRTVLVAPLNSLDEISRVLSPYRDVLQTAVLAAPPQRWNAAIDRLVEAGVTQVTAPGSAASRFLGLPHEEEFALRRLVKLIGVDLGVGPLTDPSRTSMELERIAHSLSTG